MENIIVVSAGIVLNDECKYLVIQRYGPELVESIDSYISMKKYFI